MRLFISVMIASFLAISFSTPVNAGGASSIDIVRDALRNFGFGRYMEGNCIDQPIADWIGFPTKLCRYSVAGTRAVAEVVLLDADNDQLARWIDSACRTAKVNDFVVCALRVAKHIRGQSGAQFPVAGMVLEDMDEDGKPNQFAFRDGVTVSVQGVTLGKAGGPTSSENKAALENPPISAKRFGRIAGTTREQYVAYARNASPVEGLAWLRVVRDAYQRAWRSADNDLINAWAASNAQSLSKP
jgi:endoglucanase